MSIVFSYITGVVDKKCKLKVKKYKKIKIYSIIKL